jgi:hypothetical protein
MAVPNTLAYYDVATMTAAKSFIVPAPEAYLLSCYCRLTLVFVRTSRLVAYRLHFMGQIRTLDQGILTKGKGSVQLISLNLRQDQLL